MVRQHSVLSSITLSNEVGLKPGDVANGMQIEAGWDSAREEYGQKGYLDAKLDATAAYDDQAHTVSYSVSVTEGRSITSTPWYLQASRSAPNAGFSKCGAWKRVLYSTKRFSNNF